MWRLALQQLDSLRQLSSKAEHPLRCATTAALTSLRGLQQQPQQQCCVISTSAAATAEPSSGGGLKREAGTAARFYKQAGIQDRPDEGGYGVTLDGRVVRTPARKPLVVPSLPLALAIAAEWEYQDATTLRPFTMPLMGLAATAIDQPRPRGEVIGTLLAYLDHDALCCRHEPGAVADRQSLIYDPVVDWASERFGARVQVSDSLFGGAQPVEVHAAAKRYLEGLDAWRLAAVDALASACKSVLLGCALVEGRLGAQAAVHATRIEEDMQIEEWGLVEGGHDIDVADARARIGSAAVFVRLLGVGGGRQQQQRQQQQQQ